MTLEKVCRVFRIKGEMLSCNTLKDGNINKTYKVTFKEGETERCYIVQNINQYVFKNPEHIMANINAATLHIAARLPEKDRKRGVLSFLKTEDGDNYYIDEEKKFWRSYEFIENSVTYNSFSDLDLLCRAGAAFGEFQLLMSDFDASALYEIIPDFHNTKARYARLFEKIAADEYGRVGKVQPEIEFLKSVRKTAESLVEMQQIGELPLRVTHNDTKGNNVLFDADTGEALAVIDLDTVMPGLVAYDFGDAVRFAANTADEDDPDLSKVSLSLDRFEAFAKGFVPKIKSSATDKEIQTLPLGALVMTVELAVRFLDDYIDGDKYFKLNYPEHNLVRARNQVALSKDMLKKLPKMNEIISVYAL